MCLFLLFHLKDDEPIAGGTDGRDHTHIRKFLSQHHKKLPWKPEVINIFFLLSCVCLFSQVFFNYLPLNPFFNLSDKSITYFAICAFNPLNLTRPLTHTRHHLPSVINLFYNVGEKTFLISLLRNKMHLQMSYSSQSFF